MKKLSHPWSPPFFFYEFTGYSFAFHYLPVFIERWCLNADLSARWSPVGHMMSEFSREGGPFKQDFFFPNQHDRNPCRTKAWISISKEKGECPLHAPLTLPAPRCTVLVTLVTPWAECRSGGPTKRPLVSPHNSPWWWLTLLFMERAGGSYNTLQIIAHPRSPLYSPSLNPPSLSFFLFSFFSSS